MAKPGCVVYTNLNITKYHVMFENKQTLLNQHVSVIYENSQISYIIRPSLYFFYVLLEVLQFYENKIPLIFYDDIRLTGSLLTCIYV